MRDLDRAAAIDYLQVFEGNPQGNLILADLVRRFYKPVFVAGGQEAERQTLYNAGAFDVVQYILERIKDGETAPQSTK